MNEGEDGDVDMEGVEEQEKVLQEFPLLVSEPAWNPTKEREKTIEVAMEDCGVPAFFLAKTGQLAAYVTVLLERECGCWADPIADTRKARRQHWSWTSAHETHQSQHSTTAWCWERVSATLFHTSRFMMILLISHDGRHSLCFDEMALDRACDTDTDDLSQNC